MQLINRENQATRWAQKYDLRSADMLKFQDEVAERVVEGLSIEVSGQEHAALTAPSTSSPEAYDFYLRARFYLNEYFMRSNLESLHHGQQAAQQAIDKDPSFAEAQALLGNLLDMESANFDLNSRANCSAAKTGGPTRRGRYPELRQKEALTVLGSTLTESGRNLEAINGASPCHSTCAELGTCLGHAWVYVPLCRPDRCRRTGLPA